MQPRENHRTKQGPGNEHGCCHFSGALKYKHGSDLSGGCHELVNDQFCIGIAVLLCIAKFSAARYRREHKGEPVTRWLNTHSIPDRMHHKH
jgi:hypothetical protein